MKSKEHFILLDGLRGVAALLVLLYHLFEAIAFAAGNPEQDMFHGFLAVDFFFVLSGFVMGYAYDEKWNEMSVKDFFKRRLIRLHPMVVLGVIIGLAAFIIQGCTNWEGETIPYSTILPCFFLSLFLIPSIGNLDVRGNTELFPLNGPHWSLFFEYIGSILYAVTLRKLSTKLLAVWTFFSFMLLLLIGIYGPYDNIAYGWSTEPLVFLGGFLRMNFAYPMGLLLSRFYLRKAKTAKPRGWVFIVCALLLSLLLSIPNFSWRVSYELFTIAVAFPFIVLFAAGADVKNSYGRKLVMFLGDISYPLYAVHYPLIYLYIWLISNGIHPFGNQPWITPVVIAVMAVAMAYLSYVLYDLPIRRKLMSLQNKQNNE